MSHFNRISRTVYSFLVLLLCAVFMHAPARAEITLDSIAVTPLNPAITNGQTQAFAATGTFGDGSTQQLGLPVTALAAGNSHACALLASGAVQCWGANYNGQLGNVTTTHSGTPVTVSGISTATALATGANHSCALLASGAVQCWGDNYSGQLGNGTTTDSVTPVTVSGITTATAVAAGSWYSCALLASGAVQCWGGQRLWRAGQWHDHKFQHTRHSKWDQHSHGAGVGRCTHLRAARQRRGAMLGV